MSIDRFVAEALQSMPETDPLTETMLRMNADVQTRSGLDDRTYVLVRLAALVALDASIASYLINFEAADEVGVSLQDVHGVLIALAPVVGTVRTSAAADHAIRAITEARRG
jgi:hypothetical protein